MLQNVIHTNGDKGVKMKYTEKNRVLLIIMMILLTTVVIIGCISFARVIKYGGVNGSISEVSAREAESDNADIKSKSNGDDSDKKGTIRGITVMLDAGHGGHDPGTSAGGYDEKNITFDYTNVIKEKLEYYGFNVVLSRESDEYIAPKKRAKYANKQQADLFVSIHCNYYEWDSNIAGFECYYAGDSYEGRQLADSVTDVIDGFGDIVSRGSRDNNYYVLVNTKMPAILIELGYMSNQDDLKNITDDSYMKRLSHEIAEGIYDYATK